MRPTLYLPKEKYYPLFIGLAVLLLPYLWGLFILPFRLHSYLRSPSLDKEEVTIVVSSSSSSASPISTTTTQVATSTTSRANRFHIWKGVKELVRPKWEDPPHVDYTSPSSQVASKTIRTTTTKFKTVTKPSVTTVRDQKTLTKSLTEVKKFTETQKLTETWKVTETQTETVELIVEKVIQSPRPVIELSKPDENSVVLDEIDVMGWHQVYLLQAILT